MSSFIVEDETINRIVSYLSYAQYQEFWQRQIKKKYNFDLKAFEGRQSLGRFMFNMNVKATGQRYSESEFGIGDMRSMIFEYNDSVWAGDTLQVYKSIKCWLYQCSEGSVFDSEDYKFFERIQGSIADDIIDKMPEYENAVWE